MSETITALSDSLFNQLQKEKFVLLNTIDAETGGPTSNAISWIYAVNPNTLRFAVDQRSRIVANAKQNPNVIVTFFGSGTVNAVYGKASIVTEALPEVPFKLTCMDISIEAVRDAMFYGAKISVEPEYEKTYDKRAAEKLDGQVFSAMKKA
jgi:hypothetical protein